MGRLPTSGRLYISNYDISADHSLTAHQLLKGSEAEHVLGFLVELAHYARPLLARDADLILDDALHILVVYEAFSRLIEEAEGTLDFSRLRVDFRADGGGQKLSVVDLAVAVRIDQLRDFAGLLLIGHSCLEEDSHEFLVV
jgi:hypothetical protein